MQRRSSALGASGLIHCTTVEGVTFSGRTGKCSGTSLRFASIALIGKLLALGDDQVLGRVDLEVVPRRDDDRRVRGLDDGRAGDAMARRERLAIVDGRLDRPARVVPDR